MNRPLLPCLGWLGLIALALPAEANDCDKSKCCEKQKCEVAKQCTVSTTTSCTTTAPVAMQAPTPACSATVCVPGQTGAPEQSSGTASYSTPGFTYSAPGVSYCAPGATWVVKCGKGGTSTVQVAPAATGVYTIASTTQPYAVSVPQPVVSVPEMMWGSGKSHSAAQVAPEAPQAAAQCESHGLKSFLRRILSDDQNDSDADDDPDDANAPDDEMDDTEVVEAESPCGSDAPCMHQQSKSRGLFGASLMDDDQDEIDADADSDADDADDDQDDIVEYEMPEFAEAGDVWTPEALEALQGLEGLQGLQRLEGLAALHGEDGQLHAINLEKLLAEQHRMSSDDVRRIHEDARRQAESAKQQIKEAMKAAKHAGKGADYQAAIEQAQEAIRAAQAAAHDGQLQALESLRALESIGASGGHRSKCTPPRVIIQDHAAARDHDSDLERRVSELEARMRNRGELRNDGDSDGEMDLEERVERLERAMRSDPDDFGRRSPAPAPRMKLKGPIGGSVIAPQPLLRTPRAPVANESAPDAPAVVMHMPRIAPDQAPSKDSAPMKWRVPTEPLLWKVPTAATAPRTPAPPPPALLPSPRRAPSAPSAPAARGDDEARRSARARLERLMKDMHAEVQSLRDEMLRLRRELEELPETMSEDHGR